ncbi:MAG: hypothetical protein QOI87_286 [Bradyrhizobium sp.]|jgi:hypothetical protein|nr:hypothetical protein [Bradyrhizobium sp.]
MAWSYRPHRRSKSGISGLRQIGAWSFGPMIALLCCVSASGEFNKRHHMALNVVCDFRIGL